MGILGEGRAADHSPTGGFSSQAIAREAVEYKLDSRSIIFLRVEPPALMVPEPKPVPASGSDRTEPDWPTTETVEAVVLSLSCTVYDGTHTLLRGEVDGSGFVAWSAIDFHYLREVRFFDHEGRTYSLQMGLGDSTREEAAAHNAWLEANDGRAEDRINVPNRRERIRSRRFGTGYRLVAPGEPAAAVRLGLDALHAYFEEHRIRLIWEFDTEEAARLERETSPTPEPTPERDSVIEFFPIQSDSLIRPAPTTDSSAP